MSRRILAAILFIAIAASLAAQQHPNHARGFEAEKLYDFHSIDNVNLFNGNLIVTIPIIAPLPIGGQLSQGLTLVYNGNPWDWQQGDSYPTALPSPRTNAGLGWQLTLGSLISPSDALASASQENPLWIFATPDGAEHAFYGTAALIDPRDNHVVVPGNDQQLGGVSAGYVTNPGDNTVIGYTNDSTYMRLTRVGRTCTSLGNSTSQCQASYRIDLPNGVRYNFTSEPYIHPDADPTGSEYSLSFKLTRIEDRFLNHIDVQYTPTTWTIKHYEHRATGDNELRAITVTFANAVLTESSSYRTDGQSQSRYLIDTITQTAPAAAGGEATWTFHYTGLQPTSRPMGDIGCFSASQNQPVAQLRVNFLDSVTLPDGTSYSMVHDRTLSQTVEPPTDEDPPATVTTCKYAAGHLLDLTLPTGGKIEYTPTTRHFPLPHSFDNDGDTGLPSGRRFLLMGPAQQVLRHSAAVLMRRVFDRDGKAIEATVYKAGLRNTGGSGLAGRAREEVVSVTRLNDPSTTAVPRNKNFFADKPIGYTTVYYFSVDRTGPDGCFPAPDLNPDPITNPAPETAEYGQPFTRSYPPADGLFLSSESFDLNLSGSCSEASSLPSFCGPASLNGCTVVQRSYVKYEHDGAFNFDDHNQNWRVQSSSSRTLTNAATESSVTTANSNFDGLGHYRDTTVTSNASDATRTTHNCINGDCNATAVVAPINKPDWMLELSTGVRVTNTANSITTHANVDTCFDSSTGFLRWRRTLAGTSAADHDLLSFYEPDDAGNLRHESYYGGDKTTAPVPTCPASAPPANAEYAMTHAYTAGVLQSTQYDGTNLVSPNLTIDATTGLPLTELDTAGVSTTYKFDSSRRLTDIEPTGTARTHIDYVTPMVGPVNVTLQQLDQSTRLTEKHFFYDGLGRMVLSKSLLPETPDAWSATRVLFDQYGRKKTACLPARTTVVDWEDASTCSGTTYAYDALSRTTSTTAPDGAQTTFTYDGQFTKTQTVRIATTPASIEGEPSTTRYDFDTFGRLVTVTEPLNVVANYQYDAGDHLTKVNMTATEGAQTRTFNYDSRGLLLSETHPENGTTAYTYDSRGHVHDKTTADSKFNLTYAYDAAERLTNVSSTDPVRSIKDFSFATANDGVNLRAGKLETATRHNYIDNLRPMNAAPVGQIDVVETYKYGSCLGAGCIYDDAGRMTLKTTAVKHGDGTLIQTFTQSFHYDPLSNITTETYPTCGQALCGEPKFASVLNQYTNGFLTSVPGFADQITYWPNGMYNTIKQGVLTTTQEIDRGMARPSKISVAGFTQQSCGDLAITSNSGDQTFCRPTSTTLSVTATAAGHYQWYEGPNTDDSKPIAGSDTAVLSVTPTITKSYWVKILTPDQSCSVSSATMTITILPLQLAAAPVDTSINFGTGDNTAKVSLSLSGKPPFYVTWVVDGQEQAEVTTSLYEVPFNVLFIAPGSKSVYAKVRDDCSHGAGAPAEPPITTTPVTVSALTCNWDISVASDTYSTQNAIVPVSITASLTWSGSNFTPIKYEWFHNGVLLGNTTDTITVATNNKEIYHVRVTASCSGVVSTREKDFFVYLWGTCPIGTVRIEPSPVITTTAGTTIRAITDWQPTRVHYQWYRGLKGDTSNLLANETRDHLDIDYHAVPYWVRISTDCASSDSEAVSVKVGSCDSVVITRQPQDHSIGSQEPTLLSVDANAGGTTANLSYSWFEGTGMDHPIAINRSSITVAPPETATYWVRVGNNLQGCAGYTDSFRATYHVTSCGNDHVASLPALPGAIPVNDVAHLTVTASTPANITRYDWYEGATGDTSKYLGSGADLPTLPLTHTTSFWVRLTTTGNCRFDSATVVANVCTPIQLLDSDPQDVQTARGHGLLIGVNPQAGITYAWYAGPNTDDSHPISEPGIATARSVFWAGGANTQQFWVKLSNGCIEKKSRTVTVSVCPIIDVQPTVSVSEVMPGGTATLSVQASGDALHYKWYMGGPDGGEGTLIPGDAPTITTPPINSNSTFWVDVVSGNCVTHGNLLLHVNLCSGVSIFWGFSPHPVHLNEVVSLVVVASPSFDDGGRISFYKGTTSGDVVHSSLLHGDDAPSVYTFTATESGSYWARIVRNNCIADTGVISIPVCVPIITQQPQSLMIAPAATTTLSVATDLTNVTYQWYSGTAPNGTPIQDATASSYVATAGAAGTAADYWVRITSSCNTTVDSATATVSVCVPPSMPPVYPADRSIAQGQQTELLVNASGTNLSYHWYAGTSPNTSTPVGTNNSSLFVTPSVSTDYWVRVIGTCGTLDSRTAHVSVCTAPQINTPPLTQTLFAGATVQLTVAAVESSGEPMDYTWYQGTSGDTTTQVGTGLTYTTPPLNSPANYWVRIASGLCWTDSPTAVISLCTLPQIAPGPPNQSIAQGQTVRLTLPGGSTNPNFTYAWYQGATGDTSHPLWSGGFQQLPYWDVTPAATTTQYWVQIKEGTCLSNTTATTVTQCVPTITTQPASIMINPTTTTPLTVVANTAGLTYQWYSGTSGVNGTLISNATASTYNATAGAPGTSASYWVRVTGSCGQYVDSNTAIVTVCQTAAITGQPGDRSIQYGGVAPLGVSATGTNLSYQWYQGASGTTTTPIGSNTNAINVAPLVPTDYWVKVTSSCGSVNSNTAHVSVCVTPAITAQPQNALLFSGSATTLTVTASESTGEPLHYQWYRGTSGDVSSSVGTDSPSYSTGALTITTNYWVRVYAGSCPMVDSNTATVTICPLPQSLSAPANVNVAYNQSGHLTMPAYSGYSYLWYKGASGDTSQPKTGWITNGYAYDTGALTATSQYWAQVKSPEGCISNSGTATVSVCIPTITTQPVSVMVNSGTQTTLSVAATPAGVTYQWYNGNSGNTASTVANGTGSSVTVTAGAAGSTANYWVRVSGACAPAADSVTATVTACTPPAITVQPPDRSIQSGAAAQLIVTATGSNISYQWYQGTAGTTTTPIGTNTTTINVSPATPTDYWVKITGTCGSVNSRTLHVSVCVVPTITTQPQGVAIFSGSSTVLTAAGTESTGEPLHYQWYRGASGDYSAPVGTDSSSYNTGTLSVTTNYWVALYAGACSAANSNTATVTMCSTPQSIPAPANASVAYNQGARITLTGYSGATYMWYRGASGNTSQPLTGFQSLNYYDTGNLTATTQYWAQVRSAEGCISNSPAATVSVCLPTITSQPASVLIASGNSTTLSVTATPAGSLTYQWYVGNSGTTTTPAANGTSASLSVSPTSTTNYWARVTGTCGSPLDSTTATVTVCQSPAITTQPPNASPIGPGFTSTLTVAATGSSLSYQWYRGNSGDTSAPVGTNSSTLNQVISQTDHYWVRVSNACGTANSNAAWMSVYPSIYSQPQSDVIVASGSTFSASLAANGSYLHYQWKNGNGQPVSNAPDSPNFTSPPITGETYYYCTVTSGIATRDSQPIHVTLCTGPGGYAYSAYSGSCKWVGVSVDPNANWSNITWYKGNFGDTHTVWADGSGYFTVCPTAPMTFWARVYGPDPNTGAACYSDTNEVTVYP